MNPPRSRGSTITAALNQSEPHDRVPRQKPLVCQRPETPEESRHHLPALAGWGQLQAVGVSFYSRDRDTGQDPESCFFFNSVFRCWLTVKNNAYREGVDTRPPPPWLLVTLFMGIVLSWEFIFLTIVLVMHLKLIKVTSGGDVKVTLGNQRRFQLPSSVMQADVFTSPHPRRRASDGLTPSFVHCFVKTTTRY